MQQYDCVLMAQFMNYAFYKKGMHITTTQNEGQLLEHFVERSKVLLQKKFSGAINNYGIQKDLGMAKDKLPELELFIEDRTARDYYLWGQKDLNVIMAFLSTFPIPGNVYVPQ